MRVEFLAFGMLHSDRIVWLDTYIAKVKNNGLYVLVLVTFTIVDVWYGLVVNNYVIMWLLRNAIEIIRWLINKFCYSISSILRTSYCGIKTQ